MTQPWHTPVRGRFTPIGGLGVAASVLIGLAVLADILSAWSDWFSFGVARDYLNGVPGVTETDLEAADSLAAAISIPGLLVLLAAGTVFVVWLWRARRNSEVLYGKEGHRRKSVWVGWGWVVPVVSFWFPYQIVQDVYRPSTRSSGSLVRWWWATMIAKTYLSQAVIRFYLHDEFSLENLENIAGFETLTAVLSVVAAVLIVVIIRRIVAGQLVRVADLYASVQV